MSAGMRIAVLGAGDSVGREILRTLAERGFPTTEVIALGQGRAVGSEVSFGDKIVLKLGSAEKFDFAGTGLVFCTADAAMAEAVPRAAAAGAMVIDASPRMRLEPLVPLVVPEVNARALRNATRRRIVASPEPAVVQLALALAPLMALAPIKRVVCATYEGVASAGRAGMDELFTQTRATFVNDPPLAEQFPKPIAFNVIPQTDRIESDGATRAERAMPLELRKVLDPDIAVAATCVRVPVFIGLAIAVQIEFAAPIEEAAARTALRDGAGLLFVDRREDGGYVTPAEIAGEDGVHVSRLRRDHSVPHGLGLWCVADNLRVGAALNMVRIAEALREQGLLGA